MTDTQRVFDLLVRITDCCEQIGIPYDLGFYPLRLALTTKELPEGITSAEILVPIEKISRLKTELKDELGLIVEDLEENPAYSDCCMKVTEPRSTFVNMMSACLSLTQGYAVYVTAVVTGSKQSREDDFYSKRCETAYRNGLSAKPFRGIFHRKKRRGYFSKIRIQPGRVRLLRSRYRGYDLPASHFQGHTQVMLNNRPFSAVLEPEKFLKYYYKKDLSDYPAVSNVNKARVIQQPELAFVPWNLGKAIRIKLLDKCLGLLNKFIKRCFTIINKQKRFYFRTIDRFQMADLYLPRKESYQTAYARQDWNKLQELFEPYVEIAEKYQRYKMPFAFDYECYEILIDLLLHTTPPAELLYTVSPRAKLCKWLVQTREKSFAYLAYVSSYCDPSVQG